MPIQERYPAVDPSDDYADTVDKIRVYHCDVGDESPWHVDAVDTTTGRYSEIVLRCRTHADAITYGVPEVIAAVTA